MKFSSILSVRLLKARSINRGATFTIRLFTFYVYQFFSHITPLKLINIIVAKIQKWSKRDYVWGMPYKYTIDPLNICNLRCPLCPTGLGSIGRERGKISLERFQSLIDQIYKYAYQLELYNWGEPFLHPHIFDMIRYASIRRVAVRLSSNLNHFNREMAKKTVESGLDAITISVDGSKQEIYEKYRRYGKLNKVFENIELLIEEKNNIKSKTPFITLRMIINRYNENDIDELRKIAISLGVDSFTTGTIFVDTDNQEQIDEWLPENSANSYYNYSNEKLENIWHCSDLWESVTINWDGGLAPCCWLHDKKHDYENAFDRPLKEIWNGDAYISSRRVFAFGGPKKGSIETICTVCKGKPKYLKD